jgi:hypothetical protein
MPARTAEIRVNFDDIVDRIPEIKEAFAKAERFDQIKAMLAQPEAEQISSTDMFVRICELVLTTDEMTS